MFEKEIAGVGGEMGLGFIVIFVFLNGNRYLLVEVMFKIVDFVIKVGSY